MRVSDQPHKEEFLWPRYRYYGIRTQENLHFNGNLQEFSHKVGYIAGLHSGGKLSSEQAYGEVKRLWKQLKKNRKLLDKE